MKVFLIDLDGVLVGDKKLNPLNGAKEFLEKLESEKIPFRIVSNNSTRPPSELVKLLNEKGLRIKEENFLTPLKILPMYLKSVGVQSLLLIGMESVERYLKEEGFEVVKDHRVQAVVIAQDRNLDFQKLKLAVSAVFLEGAKIIPVNLSRIVKDDDGLYFPGAGSIAMMLKHATNYQGELPNLGKPSEEFLNYALEGLERGEVYLISDDIYTDLIGAKKLGWIKTVFMTTGKYRKEELKKANFEPDYTFDSLEELTSTLLG
ncbi:HAD-IIA family hydrolase [Thermocrinis jamiesonii]|jgi:Predicted sugar phosphatases of the HAD superfamily|uniref:HAD-IIA family hydrolase n=1 Tax=Thermocrinis jamiesonii TaxID=1302351 RepID=UPI0004984125|nr:HAD-IIA family hydrolase [Thermocrinis jamiesonii]